MKNLFVLLPCLLWLTVVHATNLKPIQELEQFLASVKSLTAQFEQQVIDEHGRVSQRSQGKFYLQRPGQFRWNYDTPFKQEIVSDGNKVWFYDPDLEQVTVKSVSQALGSAPALLLSGKVKLSERFIIQSQGREGVVSWVELAPKSEDDVFKSLKVALKKGQLEWMEMADNFGQLTRIHFQNLKKNHPLPKDIFKFSPPPGVDVFEG